MTITDFNDLMTHKGHRLACITFGNNNDNIQIICDTCHEVLYEELPPKHNPLTECTCGQECLSCECEQFPADLYPCNECDHASEHECRWRPKKETQE